MANLFNKLTMRKKTSTSNYEENNDNSNTEHKTQVAPTLKNEFKVKKKIL